MNDDVSNRLDKLDGKIDKLSEAIVAIARIEERVTTVLKQNDRFILRMDRLEDRVEIVEQKEAEKLQKYSEFCNGGIMGIHSSVLPYLNKIEKNSILDLPD